MVPEINLIFMWQSCVTKSFFLWIISAFWSYKIHSQLSDSKNIEAIGFGPDVILLPSPNPAGNLEGAFEETLRAT